MIGTMAFLYPGSGPAPGHGPFTAWQKMISMALFCGVYGGMAWYVAAVEHDWAAFVWVTAFALIALGSSVGGMRVWRVQRHRQLERQPTKLHGHPPRRHPGKRHH